MSDLVEADAAPARVASAPWRVAARRFVANPLAPASLVVLLLVASVALVGGRLWRYGYADITPEFSTPPSWSHPMGTDGVGHDGLAQVLRGAQKSLQVGLLAALVSTGLGLAVGMVAGYYRGWVDALLMRFTDLVITVPGIAVLVVMAGRVRGTAGNWLAIALIVAALSWPGTARVVRAVVLSLREQEFVEAARASGASSARIIVSEMLPSAVGPICVHLTLAAGAAILAESALSFLGFGIQPPAVSWGNMLAQSRGAVGTELSYLVYAPGVAILLTVLAVNFVGNGLRDALDPQTGS